MGRKSNVQLLQEALESGDLERAKLLAQKIKPQETKLVVVEDTTSENVERKISKKSNKIRMPAIQADVESDSETVRRGGKQKTGAGDKMCKVLAFNPDEHRVNKWNDDRSEFAEESVRVNPKLGSKVSPRNREPVVMVEIQCASCMNWFETSKKAVDLSGEHWRCSKCCRGS